MRAQQQTCATCPAAVTASRITTLKAYPEGSRGHVLLYQLHSSHVLDSCWILCAVFVLEDQRRDKDIRPSLGNLAFRDCCRHRRRCSLCHGRGSLSDRSYVQSHALGKAMMPGYAGLMIFAGILRGAHALVGEADVGLVSHREIDRVRDHADIVRPIV